MRGQWWLGFDDAYVGVWKDWLKFGDVGVTAKVLGLSEEGDNV